MIQVYAASDYAKDTELRKRHTTWLNDPHTQAVLNTLECGSRGHSFVTDGKPTDDKLVILGRIQGITWVLDKIKSLDTPIRPNVEAQEDFKADPTV